MRIFTKQLTAQEMIDRGIKSYVYVNKWVLISALILGILISTR